MANAGKPNILVVFGDDIGIWNLSCYSGGMMGYRTPHIDRLANEGMRFTDCYGEQSCTAGRAAFALGQSVFRTGLSKVGMPGAPVGLQAEDPTVAELLKPLGYATGQFGKNHFGDLNRFLPTAHGFDEFFGNLYHLNAEEEPEDRDYPDPKDFPKFKERYGPRGVVHAWATDRDDPTEEPRWGRIGKQKIEDTGPLTRERMKTCDDEFVAAAQDWIKRQHKAGKPWFCWLNTTHMHVRTHTKEGSVGQAGRWQSPYHDTMIDHDRNVGAMLDLLDELGIAQDTIVMYSTDNGPHMNTWPDGAMTPFRSEKDTNWEGAFRVPALLRWPGKIEAGAVSNERTSGGWQALQSAHRRLQPLAVPDRQSAEEPAPGLHLLQRRRGPRRAALRQLEDGLRGAALHRDAADLGGAVHPATHPQALQPTHRSIRARRHDLEHLLGLVPQQGLPDRRRAGPGGAVPLHLQGVPAATTGRQLHHRPGDGEDGEGREWRGTLTGPEDT
jgi:hypothetical protein